MSDALDGKKHPTTLAEATAAAKRGCDFLDRTVPDWVQRVNASRLNMANGGYCMLGQLFGTYNKGWVALGLNHETLIRNGFCEPRRFSGYVPLTEAWQTLVRTRQAEQCGTESSAMQDELQKQRSLEPA